MAFARKRRTSEWAKTTRKIRRSFFIISSSLRSTSAGRNLISKNCFSFAFRFGVVFIPNFMIVFPSRYPERNLTYKLRLTHKCSSAEGSVDEASYDLFLLAEDFHWEFRIVPKNCFLASVERQQQQHGAGVLGRTAGKRRNNINIRNV